MFKLIIFQATVVFRYLRFVQIFFHSIFLLGTKKTVANNKITRAYLAQKNLFSEKKIMYPLTSKMQSIPEGISKSKLFNHV